MRILITGAGGFAGAHLARALAADNELTGAVRDVAPRDFPGGVVRMDLTDPSSVEEAVAKVRPDEIYHLGGVSAPSEAAQNPKWAFDVNMGGVFNILSAAARHAPGCATLVVSSSEVYGRVDAGDLPLTERQPLRPAGAYAYTKLAGERAATLCAERDGLRVVIVRPFNHTGPGQDTRFVAPAFARQIALIEAGRAEPVVTTGNLDAGRDFLDVRDVARAYVAALRQGVSGEVYNICSGKPVTPREILETLFSLSTVKNIARKVDPARGRPSDNPSVFGDATALTARSGWRPEIPLERTLRDLLIHERVLAREV